MTVTYTDIVRAMVEAKKDGHDTESVVLTDESFDTFIADNSFNEEVEKLAADHLGDVWTITLERGDEDYITTESGSEIKL